MLTNFPNFTEIVKRVLYIGMEIALAFLKFPLNMMQQNFSMQFSPNSWRKKKKESERDADESKQNKK